MSILNTSWEDKNLKKSTIWNIVRTSILHCNNDKKLLMRCKKWIVHKIIRQFVCSFFSYGFYSLILLNTWKKNFLEFSWNFEFSYSDCFEGCNYVTVHLFTCKLFKKHSKFENFDSIKKKIGKKWKKILKKLTWIKKNQRIRVKCKQKKTFSDYLLNICSQISEFFDIIIMQNQCFPNLKYK